MIMKKTANLNCKIDSDIRWIWTADVQANSYIAALGKLEIDAIPDNAAIKIFADTKYGSSAFCE